MAGLGPFKMVNAAEIIRYTEAGWSPADIQQTEKHFKEVICPVLKDFAPFANGNWDAAAVKTVLRVIQCSWEKLKNIINLQLHVHLGKNSANLTAV